MNTFSGHSLIQHPREDVFIIQSPPRLFNWILLGSTRELLVRMDVQDLRAPREPVDNLVSWDSPDPREHR